MSKLETPLHTAGRAALKRVLIIDDDSGCREAMSTILTLEGFEVFTRACGNNFSLLLEQIRPDLLLVDYLLPGISGGEICSYIKRDACTRHLPVILISAWSQVSRLPGYSDCTAFIAKPFELKHLVRTIRSILRGNDCP